MFKKRTLIFGLTLCFVSPVLATDEVAQMINYQGQFFNEAGTAPLLDTVNLTLEILDPTGTCLLYSEQQNGIDLSTTSGYFAIQIGSLTLPAPEAAKRTVSPPAPATEKDPGFTMAQIFSNAGSITGSIANCTSGYTPAAGDGRLLRVIVDDVTTGTTVTLTPNLPIAATAQAITSQTLQGIAPTGFLQVDSTATQAHIDTLTAGSTSDASTLHNHDSLYVKLSSTTSQSLGSGTTYTAAGSIGIGTASPGGNLEVDAESAGAIGEIIKGHSGQTSDLLDIYNGAGTLSTKIDASGNINETGAFIQNGEAAPTVSGSTQGIIYFDSTSKTFQVSEGGSAYATLATATSISGSYLPLAGGSLTGNLGIGVNPATLPLDVQASPSVSAPANAIGRIKDLSATGSNTTYGGLLLSSGAGDDFIIGKKSVNTVGYLDVRDETSGTSLMTVDSTGHVGIGNTPTATLDVAGQVHAQVFSNGSSTAIDWNKGNIQTTSANCSGVATQFTFANMLEGGSYTLIVTGTTPTGSCNFTSGTTVTPSGNTGFSFLPANATPTTSTTTVYTFLRAGNVVYVSWITGFPAAS